MKKLILVAILSSFFIPIAVGAQAPTQMFWTEQAPSLAIAQGYTYKDYIGGSPNGVTVTNVVCSGASSPYNCTSNIPPGALTGTNQLTATDTVGGTGESGKSALFQYSPAAIPASPGFK